MIVKLEILVILLLTIQNLHAQKTDSSRVKALGETILNTKNSPDQQTQALLELTKIYVESNDTSMESYAEGMIIKFTNISSQYFFHEYEVNLPDFLNRYKVSLYKKARLYLVLSNKQGTEINFDYHSKAINLIEKSKSSCFELKKVKCDSTLFLQNSDIQKLINSKKVRTCNNYYLTLLLSCEKDKKKLDQVKRNYFLVM